MNRNIRIKKIIYQSNHRGCKETDAILGDFARTHVPHFSDEELDLFEQFIMEDDWDIYAWLTHNHPLPEKYHHPIILKLQQSL